MLISIIKHCKEFIVKIIILAGIIFFNFIYIYKIYIEILLSIKI